MRKRKHAQGSWTGRWPERLSALSNDGLVMAALYFIFYGGMGAWFPFLNVHYKRLGLSGFQIGALASILPAIMLVSQPLWGVIADLWGRRRTLMAVVLSTAGLILGLAWGESFWFFVAWSTLYAMLSSPGMPLLDSLCLAYKERNAALSYGRLRLWGSISWAVVAFSVGRLITDRDMRLAFLIGASLMFACGLLTWRAVRDVSDDGALERSWRDLGPLLRNRRLVLFLVLVTLLQVGSSPAYIFFSVFMEDLGATNQQLGLAFAIQALSELPIFFAATALVDRLGTVWVVFLAALLFASRAFLYVFISQPALAIAAQVFQGAFALFMAGSVEHVNRLLPSQWQSTGQTLFSAAYFSAGSILGNALGGYLYDRLGPHTMFGLNAALILLVALAMRFTLQDVPTDDARDRADSSASGGQGDRSEGDEVNS